MACHPGDRITVCFGPQLLKAKFIKTRIHESHRNRQDCIPLIQAQAQYAGGTPERWASHARKWRELGATHLAVATHNAGDTDTDGHLARIAEYLESVC